MKAYVIMEVELAGYESLRRGFGASAKPKYGNRSTEVRRKAAEPYEHFVDFTIQFLDFVDTAHEQSMNHIHLSPDAHRIQLCHRHLTVHHYAARQGLISYSVATSPIMYELAFGLARTLFIRP